MRPHEALVTLINERMDGRLPDEIARLRRLGASYQVIANYVTEEVGIPVGRETVRRWVINGQIILPDAAA